MSSLIAGVWLVRPGVGFTENLNQTIPFSPRLVLHGEEHNNCHREMAGGKNGTERKKKERGAKEEIWVGVDDCHREMGGGKEEWDKGGRGRKEGQRIWVGVGEGEVVFNSYLAIDSDPGSVLMWRVQSLSLIVILQVQPEIQYRADYMQ